MALTDPIFQKKCVNCRKIGEYICPDCLIRITFNDNLKCPICGRVSVNGVTHSYCQKGSEIDAVMTITNYNNVSKKLLYQFKNPPYVSKLAGIIATIMIEGLIQNEVFYRFVETNNPIIIPMPMHPKRIKKQGYNHTELLAKYVAQYFKLKIHTNTFQYIKDVKILTENINQKFESYENSFEISKNAKIPKFVILIDDSTTNLSSFKKAAKSLKNADCKGVIGISFTSGI